MAGDINDANGDKGVFVVFLDISAWLVVVLGGVDVALAVGVDVVLAGGDAGLGGGEVAIEATDGGGGCGGADAGVGGGGFFLKSSKNQLS